MHEGLQGGLGTTILGLLGGKGTKYNQHGGINGTRIVEQDTNYFLNVLAVGSVEHSCVVRLQGVLDFGTIGWLLLSMWCMFGPHRMGVAEAHKGTFNIP